MPCRLSEAGNRRVRPALRAMRSNGGRCSQISLERCQRIVVKWIEYGVARAEQLWQETKFSSAERADRDEAGIGLAGLGQDNFLAAPNVV